MLYKSLLCLTAIMCAVALSACGDDDDDTVAGDDNLPATSDAANGGESDEDGDAAQGDEVDQGADPGDGGGGGSGQATLTIGEETWTFDGIFCAFSPEEAQNERVSFTLTSFGETAAGVRTQLDATIQDTQEQGRYEGDGVIHSLTLDDVEDFENPSVDWSAESGFLGMGEPLLQIDGKSVAAESVFDDGRTDDAIEEVPGSFAATCP